MRIFWVVPMFAWFLLTACADTGRDHSGSFESDAEFQERWRLEALERTAELAALARGWDGVCDYEGFSVRAAPYESAASAVERGNEFSAASDFGCLAAAACVVDEILHVPNAGGMGRLYQTSVMASLWGFDVTSDPGRGWMDPADPNGWSRVDDRARERFDEVQDYLAHTGQTSAEAVPNCPAFAPRPVDPERVLFDPEACMELAHVPACVPYADAGERARLGLPPREEEGG